MISFQFSKFTFKIIKNYKGSIITHENSTIGYPTFHHVLQHLMMQGPTVIKVRVQRSGIDTIKYHTCAM